MVLIQTTEPSYITAHRDGRLKESAKKAADLLSDCTLCPRKCHVDRNANETGFCRTGKKARLSSYHAHFGEEAPLVERSGSGTIFFTHCNLRCTFCQNYDISHLGYGEEVTSEQLADVMLQLQKTGCLNINFVTPSHVIAQILSALEIAIDKGLHIPLIYNTGGYDRIETLKLLDGIIDIYMPDFKFWSSDNAKTSCNADDYPEVARNALIEMHRQVGDLEIDESGIARRGLLIRHLVLPDDFSGTRDVMRFISQKISSNSYVNIMPQYRPCGRASEIPALKNRLSSDEYEKTILIAKSEGITRLDVPRRVFILR